MYPLTERPKDCRWRHENGNCTIVGGFCTAVNENVCKALREAYKDGQRDLSEAVINLIKHKLMEADE